MRSRHAPRVIAARNSYWINILARFRQEVSLLFLHIMKTPSDQLGLFVHLQGGRRSTVLQTERISKSIRAPSRTRKTDCMRTIAKFLKPEDANIVPAPLKTSAEEWLKVGPQLLTECSSGKPTPPIESKLSGNDFLLLRRNLSQRCRVQIQVRRCHFGRHASDPVVQ